MQYRNLGNTGLQISAVGLGTWALGGGYDWGNSSLQDAQRTVAAAVDVGINVIDTAPVYGQSEEFLGRALAGKRNKFLLSTKCGLVKNGSWTDHDLRPATIVSQLETSLKKLKTNCIDLYWIHYLDPQVAWQEVLRTLEQLRAQGKIRYIGVCNVAHDILAEIAATGVISCVQDELSLLHPHKAFLLNVCQQYHLGFFAYGPLCGGILSGKYKQEPNFRRADARNYFYKCYRADAYKQAQTRVEKVKQLACQKQVAPAQVALAWVLAQPGVTSVLAGARQEAQVFQNAQAAQVELSTEEICNLLK